MPPFRPLIRPLLIYGTAATAVGGAAVIYIYRPLEIPGSEAPAVPLRFAADGSVAPPRFPHARTRAEQIADLKKSAAAENRKIEEDNEGIVEKARRLVLHWGRGGDQKKVDAAKEAEGAEVEYDLLIIGAGATGAGIALDAATRGLKVACIEREDFSAGTSSKSTKLVHGGVRYLEKAVWELDYKQYALVKEALRERKYFLKTAPHLSTWLPIMLPVKKWWEAPYYWMGTKAYDFLAGSEGIESSYFLTRSKALEEFPMLRKQDLVGALVYYDGAHNDSRMNVSLAMTAALYDATIINHVEVTGLEKDPKTGQLNAAWMKDLVNEKDGKPSPAFKVRAKGIINATGPFSDSIRKMDDASVSEIVAPSSGVHVILPGYYSPANMGLIEPKTSDGRVIFFLPWQGNTIAGTTDAPTAIQPNPIAGEEEIEWILKEIRAYLAPDINVRRGDVLAAWSGIRPLVRDPQAKRTEALVRSHLNTFSPSGLLTCAGGKWTTYRQMAEEAVDEAIEHFRLDPRPVASAPAISGTEHVDDAAPLDGTCQTHQVRLIGAHGYSKTLFINLIQHFGLETDVARHLVESYGDRAWTVAALCSPTDARFPARGLPLAPLYPFVDGEVRYAVRHEYAQTAVDVLARRTRLAFLNAQSALEALPMVIDLMAEDLHWGKERKEREWKDSVAFLRSMGLPKTREGVSRKDVESGRSKVFDELERKMYSRYDGPADTIESDMKLWNSQPNPGLDRESPANK